MGRLLGRLILIAWFSVLPALAWADGIPNPPPPMPREYVPPKPTLQGVVVWVPGYWQWDGEKYVWLRGAYLQPPTPGLHWNPGHWVADRGEWFWIAGYWR